MCPLIAYDLLEVIISLTAQFIHRITEHPKLEGTSKDHLVQPCKVKGA